jgi:hypothetical protein
MNFPFTIFNIILWCLFAVAIVRCCIGCQGTRNNSATQTTAQTTSQTEETAPSGETSQQQATATDGIDPALLRAKVIDSIFPGQTVRALIALEVVSVSISVALFISQNTSCIFAQLAQQSLLTHSVLFYLFLIRLITTRLSCMTLKLILTSGPTTRLVMRHALFV